MINKFTKTKLLFVLIYIIATTVVLSSCVFLFAAFDYSYDGNHEDLYTVAVNNIYGIWGHTSNGEISYNPEISIIEEDKYGRVFFFYNERYGRGADYGMAFIIAQKSDDKYIYYYQDRCYSPFFDSSDYFYDGRDDGKEYKIALELSKKQIEELKNNNDWNKELQLEKCTKTKISSEKTEGDNMSLGYEEDLEAAIYSYAKKNGNKGTDEDPVHHYIYCNKDIEGKELYYVYCLRSYTNENNEVEYIDNYYAVIISTNNNNDVVIPEKAIVEITDVTKSYEIIKQLKEQNNWQYPWYFLKQTG